jgi:hypothetical protein
MRLFPFLKKLTSDRGFALCTVIIGVVIIVFSFTFNAQQYDMGLVILLPGVVWLVIRKWSAPITGVNNKKRFSKKQLITTTIIFFMLVIVCCIILITSPFHRPLSFYVTFCVAVAIVVTQGIQCDKKWIEFLCIFEILFLAFLLRASMFYQFPTISGSDTWSHLLGAESISSTGWITGNEGILGKYADYPIYHILISIINNVVGLGMKDSLFAVAIAVIIVSAIIVFKIASNISGSVGGLLAIVLFVCADNIIVLTLKNTNPGMLVLPYFLMALYLLTRRARSLRTYTIVIILLMLIIMTHQLTSFISMVILFVSTSFLLLSNIWKRLDGRERLLDWAITCIGIILMMLYWSLTRQNLSSDKSFFEFTIVNAINTLFSGKMLSEVGSSAYVEYVQYYSLISNVLIHIGYLALISIAVLTIAFWLKNDRDDRKLLFGFLAIFLWAVIYGFSITALGRNLLLQRWLPFICIFLTVIVGAGIAIFSSGGKYRLRNITCVVGITLIIGFMITTPIINSESAIYSNERASRAMYTPMEVSSALFAIEVTDKNIHIDGSFKNYFRQFSDVSTIGDYGERSKTGEIILAREAIEREYHSGSSRASLSLLQPPIPDYINGFLDSNYNAIYRNGDVYIFMK